MLPSIDEFILARATAMAEHDGDQLGPLFIMGAAALLQGEIISARDRLLAKPAGSAHEPGVADVPMQEIALDQGSAPVPAPEEAEAEPDAPAAEPEVEEVPVTDPEPKEAATAKDDAE